jgi:hypothetical protein
MTDEIIANVSPSRATPPSIGYIYHLKNSTPRHCQAGGSGGPVTVRGGVVR